MASKTALVSSDYRVWWVASDCVTVIAGITDAGLLETLAGFEFDIDLTSGYAITVDIEVPLASDTYVQGIDVDLQQSAGYTDTWSTAGGLIGIRSDVHVDFVITDCYAGYFNVYVDPAATCTLNDILGVFGRIVLVGPVTAGAATSQVAALRGSISNSSTGSYDGQVFALSLDFGSAVNYGSTTAMIYAWTHADSRCDYGFYLNNYSPYMVAGIYLSETAGASPAMTTGILIDGTVDKGIDLTDATLSQSWDNAFVAIGSGNGSAGDQHSFSATTHYIPIQVNAVSIANPTGVSEISAAMLRMDADTADQANSSIDVLTIRSDIAKNVYAATCINASLNISADISVPTATVQGLFVQISGNKTITCPNTVNVLEAVYKQTSGGGGVDNVGEFACNATDCSISNILRLTNYNGTVTNGILLVGTLTTGIDLGDGCTTGIDVGTCATTGIAFTGTVPKGIDFANATLTTGDADNAFIAIGTWNDAYTVPAQTAHFVPLQVNLSSESSFAGDVAAARLRVNTGAANTLTAVNVLELRSILAHDVAQHANLQVSTNVTGAVTSTGETFVGYFSLEGTGVLSGGNVSVLKANSHMNGAGCDNVIFGTVYGTGAIVTNVINGYVEPGGTTTNILSLTNAGGTVTTGIVVGGTMTTGISISGAMTNGLYIADTDIAIQTGVSGTSAGDVFFYGDLTSSYVQWDASEDRLIVQNTFAADGDVSSYEYGQYNGMAFNTAITTGKIVSGMKVAMEGTADYDSGALVFPLWIDIQNTGTNNAAAFYMARFSVQSGACLPNAYIQFQTASPGVEWLFAVDGNVAPYTAGGTDCTASGATDPKGTLAVRVPDGSTAYIRVWAAK